MTDSVKYDRATASCGGIWGAAGSTNAAALASASAGVISPSAATRSSAWRRRKRARSGRTNGS